MQQFGSPPHPPPRVRCSESWLRRWTDIMIKGSSRPVADPDFPKAGVWNVPSRRIRPTCGNYTSACRQASNRNLGSFPVIYSILPKRRTPFYPKEEYHVCLMLISFFWGKGHAPPCTPLDPPLLTDSRLTWKRDPIDWHEERGESSDSVLHRGILAGSPTITPFGRPTIHSFGRRLCHLLHSHSEQRGNHSFTLHREMYVFFIFCCNMKRILITL